MALPVRVSRGQPYGGYDPLELSRRDFSDVLDRFFGGGFERGWPSGYGVDVREDADHIYVEADVPGFRKEEIDVTLENGTLTITAEKRQEPQPAAGQPKGQPKENYLLRERRFERFERSFTLPQNVDEQQVNAKLKEGCLTITLNKSAESKPKRINIS